METRNRVGDAWIASDSGATLEVRNPANDELIASVPRCGASEARAAIDAAARALPAWRALPAQERARPLRRLFELMHRDTDRLARLLSAEQGKPLAEARGEIAYAASFIEWAAEEGRRLYGDIVPASTPDRRILVLRQPIGVTAAITPWNFPAAMITRKLGPALAAGCTMIVKPAEQTPLSALALAELAIEAGLPDGVMNVITGDAPAIGGAIFADPRVRKVSFTGSTEVGRILMGLAAQNLVRLSLELGGHAPFLVFEDADLDAAVAGALVSKFRNMGQTCICPNRFYVADAVYDAFVAKLAAAASALKVAPAWVEGAQVGPLIDDAAVDKVNQHIDDALTRGARAVTGARWLDLGPGLSRRFCAPTVLDGVTPDMLVSTEETFGPVAPVQRFHSEAEAIALANASPYGLASYFYSRDAGRLMRVAEALEYGIVGANDGAVSTAQAPFGGVKASGFGREGGKYVMDEYTTLKYVSWKI